MSLCILLVYELQSRQPGKAVWRKGFLLTWLSTSAVCLMHVFAFLSLKRNGSSESAMAMSWLRHFWNLFRWQTPIGFCGEEGRQVRFVFVPWRVYLRRRKLESVRACGVKWGWISVFCSGAGVIFGTPVHPDANVKLRLTLGNSQLCCQIQWQELAALSLISVLTRTPAVCFFNADKICVPSELDFKSH